MTKTIHPVLSHYSSTKWRGRGGGALSREGGAYFKFQPIGGALIRGGGEAANSKIYGIPDDLNLHFLEPWCIRI